MNPWGITEAEAVALQAVIDHGSFKAAALAIARSTKTVEAHICNVRKRMAEPGDRRRRSLVQICVAWDRWARDARS